MPARPVAWRTQAAISWIGLVPVAQGTAEPYAGQDAAIEETATALEVIVVTARRRTEPLLEVPVALSVFDSQLIEKRQLRDLHALQYATPNMTVAGSQTSRGTASIAIRGQFEPDPSPTVDGAVGIYLDGVYLSRAVGANLDLIDMQRVEVLRGPQGTLYGRNTIGGAINLIANKPTPLFEASLEIGAGNYERRDLKGVVNLPFGAGRHAIRLAAAHREHDGYGFSTLLGTDLDDEDTDFVRAQWLMELSARDTLTVAFDWTESKSNGQLVTLAAAHPPEFEIVDDAGHPVDTLGHYVGPQLRRVPVNRAGWTKSLQRGASLNFSHDFDSATLVSITAWRELDIRARDTDLDGTPYDLEWIPSRNDRHEQWSQELQLGGMAAGDRLHWTTGLYWLDEHGSLYQRSRRYSPVIGYLNESRPDGETDNESIAAYAQVAYSLTRTTKLNAGLRYNEDSRQLTSRNSLVLRGTEVCRLSPAVRDSPERCRATLPAREFSYLPAMIGLDFKPSDDALLYAKFSRGYRAGGYNIRGAGEIDLSTFGPEDVSTIEFGVRWESFARRLRLDLALFRTLFDDIQLTQRQGNVRFVQNGGEARINGGEFELAAAMGRLRLTAALGLIDATYTRIDPAVDGVSRDSSFLHTPGETVSLAASYSIPLSIGELTLNADAAWRDGMSFSYDPGHPANQGAYGLLNAVFTLSLPRHSVEVDLWGRNLTDTHYIERAFASPGTAVVSGAVPGDPRTYGLALRCRIP